MTTREKYDELILELQCIESITGLYLTDENADVENVGPDLTYNSEAFWRAMILSAEMSAGQRAENKGQCINQLIGRTIY